MAKRNAEPKYVTVKVPLGEAISDAFSEFQSLSEEMGEWRDNIEEKFGTTQKFEQVSEAADTLEQRTEPTVDDLIKDTEVEVTRRNPKRPSRRGESRATRCSNACGELEAAMEKLEELKEQAEQWLNDYDGMDAATQAEESTQKERERQQSIMDAADGLWQELDAEKGEAEAVEFPGMFG